MIKGKNLKDGIEMNRNFFLFLLLFFLSLSGSPIFPQQEELQKRLWEIQDTFRIRSIKNLQLSPDNKWLFFIISERNLDHNRHYSSLWFISTRGGEPKQLTELKGSVSSPRWSPDGKKIAFFSTDKEGLGLWVMNRYSFYPWGVGFLL